MDDWTLLKDYAENGDEGAFTQLVERHIGLVFHAAYRHLNDASAAEEIAQAVFANLAAKARSLKSRGSLAAWLYRVACCKAVDFHRCESARKRREHEHAEGMKEPLDECREEVLWPDVAPLLDEAMSSLTEEQRTAVLMRVFEERPLSEVGIALGIGEDAARKRVARALDQLRAWFERRGIHCHSAALSVAIGAFAAAPLAAELIHSTARAALQHSAAVCITSTSTVITMASMKLPITLGLIVGAAVPISLGYFTSPVVALPPAQIVSLSRPSFELSDAETNGLMADWKRLREEHGPDAGSMENLYRAVAAIRNDFRRGSFLTALLTEWVENDASGALAFFEAERDDSRIEDILMFWIKRDPKAAIAAMKQGGKVVQDEIGDLLDEVAEVSPSDLGDLAVLMKTTGLPDPRLQDAFTVAARHDPNLVKAATMNLEGHARKDALTGIARAWGEKDGPAAFKWMESFETDQDRSMIFQALLIGWARSDPPEAIKQLVLDDGLLIDDQGAYSIFHEAMESDLDGTLDWLALNPNEIDVREDAYRRHFGEPLWELRKRFLNDIPGTLKVVCEHPAGDLLALTLNSILYTSGSGHREEAWRWLQSQPPSEIATRLKRELFWYKSDHNKQLDRAEAFLSDNSIPDNDASNLASLLISNQEGPASFEDLVERTPAVLHIELLKAGFREFQEQDVGYWTERLDELPLQDRSKAIDSLASARARTDPAGAIAWADTLSAAERSLAYSGIARTWAEADGHEASEWITRLSPGPERDYAAAALVEAVADAEPHSAWIWAQTINEPDQRSESLQTALKRYGPDAALMIGESNLPESDKVALLKWANEQLQKDETE